MKIISDNKKRFLYGGYLQLFAPIASTISTSLSKLPTMLATNNALSLSTLALSNFPVTLNGGLINFDPLNSNDAVGFIRYADNTLKNSTKDNKFSFKKEGMLKRVVKNMTDYGGWNTAMLIGSGISVGTGLVTSGLNIAESLKQQPKMDPIHELGVEPLMHARFY